MRLSREIEEGGLSIRIEVETTEKRATDITRGLMLKKSRKPIPKAKVAPVAARLRKAFAQFLGDFKAAQSEAKGS